SRAFGSPKTPRTVGCTRNPPNAYVSHNRRSRLFDAAIATPCQNSPYRKMLQARCPRGFQMDSTPNFTHSITRRPSNFILDEIVCNGLCPQRGFSVLLP